MSKFFCANNSGFSMTFENGLTISVRWGGGLRCDNRYKRFDKHDDWVESETAEVAVFANGEFAIIDQFLPQTLSNGNDSDDMTVGYLTTEEVLYVMAKVKLASAENVQVYSSDYYDDCE